jgi:PAS domain S-box-containing protein
MSADAPVPKRVGHAPATIDELADLVTDTPPVARVLVVDDDERNLLATTTVLEDIAEVVVARSGEEALRHLLKGEFAVILLDVYMPGMDGYETASIIRQREQTKRIPIIFLSAVNKETEHSIRGYSMGAVDYVFKPVEPIVLRSKVTVFVDLFLMTKEIQRKARQEQQLLDENLRANTERLRAEQELRLAEQRQAAIIQSLPIILYLEAVDASPRAPKFVSGNFTALTGYEFKDVQAAPQLWLDRLHDEDRERVVAALAGRQYGQSLSVEYRWQCSDGRYKHFLDQAVLLRDAEGQPVEYAGTLLDVTDRKQLESQLVHVRKMDAVGKLTGGIAHDFNNLLAAVLGGLTLLDRRAPLSEEQRKILAMTRHAAEQGTELVGRLLAFARRQQLNPARIETAKLFATVKDLLAHTLGGLVELSVEAPEGAWSAFADEAQLELALMNLVINARDAMPDGGRISMSARNEEVGNAGDLGLPPGRFVVFCVEDTGVGIGPELLEQVMEPFFTTKEVGKGTGLGLSMVYGFVKQSGGAIQMHSAVGKGTRVEIWLPEHQPDPNSAVEPKGRSGKAKTVSRARPLKLLLVDDHDGVRATTAAMLEDLGHTVTQAAEGDEALAALAADPDGYDVVVSDYAMPHLSGAELIRRARELRPEMPAMIITGYADSQSIARRPERVIVLAKPFTPDQISAALTATTARRAKASASERVA